MSNALYADLFARIEQSPVYDVAIKTELQHAPLLSHRCHTNIYLKREDKQSVFSFKCRGAYAKMVSLPKSKLACGVIAASAGNHAQGVALAAQKLGVSASIVMPKITPTIKIDAVKRLGATVVLEGDHYDAACEHATMLCKQQGLTFIHPYDDLDVIVGQ